jgi:succinate dehydrogenase/fumarate reductase flavoprotein subunit
VEENDMIETDVVVVGYGGAGAAAAITAHDKGAEVLILEKMPNGGGNTRLSNGHLFTTKSEGAVKYLEALCFGKTSSEIIQTYVKGCMEINDWIKKMGGQTEVSHILEVIYPTWGIPSWPNFPGVEHTEVCEVSGGTVNEPLAMPLWRLLTNNVERRRIKVMTNTPVKELTTDGNGEVIGLIAEREGKQTSIKAKKAVILSCGGFEYNEVMKDAFLPLTPLYAIGSPGNTGDGVAMAQKVGAALWHMSAFYGWFVFKSREYPAAFTISFHNPSFIYVDKDGRRFGDETGFEGHERSKALVTYMPRRQNYPHLPAYAVFDDVTRRKGPLTGIRSSGEPNNYKWSLDNSREISKGWISQGKTIDELARRISIDEATLTNTLLRYNRDCKAGNDAEFARSKETLEPIEVAPYYAIELWPGIGTASGGPRRDKEARVVDHQGKPIRRLYSAGGLGSIWGFLTVSGSGLTDAIVFGQIAGRNAAAEEPWM